MTISTIQVFNLDGVATRFPVNFEYLARSFVKVTLRGATRRPLTLVTEFVFETSSQIRLLTPWGPSDGFTSLEIRRETSTTDRIVDFNDATILRAQDLNTAELQSMHIAEEARNVVFDVLGTDPEGNLDARNRRIVNIADPINPGDAVNFRTYTADITGIIASRDEAVAAAAAAAESAAESEGNAALAAILKAGLASPEGGGMVKWLQGSGIPGGTTGVVTVQEGLDLLYFGIANIRSSRFAGGATGDGSGLRDVEAFAAACASGCPNIYAPAGIYVTGPTTGFLFGSQNTTGQSSGPITLLADGWGTIFRAAPGFAGTVLQGWSLAGVRWGSFQVDGNNTAYHCIDTDWKPGVGPSLQSVFAHIRCYGAIGDSVWRCWNNNDTKFDACYTIGTREGMKGFDLKASGGLIYMNNCIWDHCYLSLGGQNGVIRDSWGFGIQFAGSSINYISISGGYIYSNVSRQACLWSESFEPFQSVGSLTVDSTQFIGGSTNACFFDLNMYSGGVYTGCQFVNTNPMTMFGANSRSDSFATVKNTFRRGSVAGGTLIDYTPPQFSIEYDGFMDDSTRRAFPDQSFNLYLEAGQGPQAWAANVWYDLLGPGSLPAGTYKLFVNWSHNGAGAPFFVTASTQVCIPPQWQDIPATGPVTVGTIASYNIGGLTTMSFRLSTAGDGQGPRVQFMCNQNLGAGGTLNIRATREM